MATRRLRRRVDGVLLLDKPAGVTSNGALQVAKRLFDAEKAGHTGTLDPFATGLLPICFGEATKFAQALLDARKAYVATVHFGVRTSTGDIDGGVVAQSPVALTRDAIEAALPRFRGRIAQLPPMHSALKRDGRPYYEYARKGIELARTAREVDIEELVLTGWTSPRATLRLACSKGTYVRVLAEDLGAALGCGAHLAALRRSATGGFAIDDAVTLDQLADMTAGARDALLRPVETLLESLPALSVDAPGAAALRNGREVAAPDQAPGRYRCRDPHQALVGVVEVAHGVLRAERLCRTDGACATPREANAT
ncbi:MAG: tRNA pseudouridine(55) synthase TruB [Betaproteobacteria bacterium]